MPQPVSIAVGRKGLELQVPDGIALSLACEPLDATEPLRLQEQRDILAEALKNPTDIAPLANLVEGKRRVCVVVGDLSHPAPYSVALPALTKALVDAGIRPSRISVLVCPGDCGTLLGRSVIRRYGEEIVGDFELRPWQSPDALKPEADEGFANADVRIALQPAGLPALPLPGNLDLVLEFSLGRRARIDIVAAKARGPNTKGLVTANHLNDALKHQREKGGTLGQSLVELGLISAKDLTKAQASQHGMETIDLSQVNPSPEALKLVSPTMAHLYKILPISFKNNCLMIAMADATNVTAVDELQFMLNCEVVPVLATRDQISAAILQYYGPPEPNTQADVFLTAGGGDDWEASLEEALLSVHGERLSPVTVLAFAGGDGLGSALFGRNVQETIQAFERGALKPEASANYHPLRAFEQALLTTEKLVLFSENFVGHPDGDDFLEWLDSCPKALERILVCDTPQDLWETLRQVKGESYSLAVNPLGWRSKL